MDSGKYSVLNCCFFVLNYFPEGSENDFVSDMGDDCK